MPNAPMITNQPVPARNPAIIGRGISHQTAGLQAAKEEKGHSKGQGRKQRECYDGGRARFPAWQAR